jgi:hydroxylamine reductase
VTWNLFTTITNVAWDDDVIIGRIREALKVREAVKKKAGAVASRALPDCATWTW